MWEYIKLNLMLLVALVCGPCFAILLSFYLDVISLSQQYKFLQHINYDWKLLMVFGIFWIGIYSALAFWSSLKRLIYKAPKLDWWQSEAIYQIYVKSFFDSNGDGIGDLRGIIQKLDYIQSLGTRAIWLSPIHSSAGKNSGLDVTSFLEIDPAYGTIKDFDELVDQVHRRDMYLIIDFSPTHTSNQHQWFIESCKDEPNNRFKDFYIWYSSKDSQNPPNNWKSAYGGPAWTYVESRKAWYFHNYLPEQPSLNLRCADVKGELESVITFWLERKRVDGLRLESPEYLFVSERFENEPVINKFKSSDQLEYADLKHVHTTNLPATFELLNEWRGIVCSLSKRNKSDKALIVKPTIGANQIDKFYTFENKKGAHLAINTKFFNLSQQSADVKILDDTKLFKPKDVKSLIEDYLSQMPKGGWTSWQLGDYSVPRVASRIGSENVNLANVVNLLLGGTPVVYYGEEIGMEDLPKENLKFEECQDELARKQGPNGYLQSTRDFERTPMQWENSNFAGFTRADRTWLPVNPNFKEINVQAQTGHKRSTLSVFRDLVDLRRNSSFQFGAVKMVTVNDQVFSFLRKAFGCDVYLVCMNLSDTNTNVNLLVSNEIAPRAYVSLYIPGTLYTENNGCCGAVEDIDLDAKYKPKSPVLTKNVFLKARDCLILTWPTSD